LSSGLGIEDRGRAFAAAALELLAATAGAFGVAGGIGRGGFGFHARFCVKFCQLALVSFFVLHDLGVGFDAGSRFMDGGGAVFEVSGGEAPLLVGEEEDSRAEEDRGRGFGVIEDLFELVEGFGAEGLHAVADGEGVLLFGEGKGLLEGGVVGPAIDSGTGNGGELSSSGHGGACGEGLEDRDLSRGKGFHSAFRIMDANSDTFSHG
jgi:hypothetical protein